VENIKRSRIVAECNVSTILTRQYTDACRHEFQGDLLYLWLLGHACLKWATGGVPQRFHYCQELGSVPLKQLHQHSLCRGSRPRHLKRSEGRGRSGERENENARERVRERDIRTIVIKIQKIAVNFYNHLKGSDAHTFHHKHKQAQSTQLDPTKAKKAKR
jgi:hypothetical protein